MGLEGPGAPDRKEKFANLRILESIIFEDKAILNGCLQV